MQGFHTELETVKAIEAQKSGGCIAAAPAESGTVRDNFPE